MEVFVASLDLADVVDDALAFGTECSDDQRHAGANVRTGEVVAVQPGGADDDGSTA